ncbi:MAG: hypothetical protein Q8L86_04150 [Vicinamibacterales bacterium]|nr:hypothetical protein [Vicinamibacterales bacterium]
MGVGAAFVQGWQRVWRARVLLAGVLLATAALATVVPVAGSAALGPASRVTGLGLAAALELRPGLDEALGARPVALAAHLAASLVLLGALLARLAADRPLGLRGCLAAGTVRVFRFFRLTLIASAGAGAAVALFVAFPTPAGAGLARALLFVISLVTSYGEVRLVVEDRRTVLGTLVAGWRFVRAHPAATVGLHLVNAMIGGAAFLPLIFLGPSDAAATGWAPTAEPLLLLPVVVAQVHAAASQMALFDAHLGRRPAAAEAARHTDMNRRP